MSTSNPPKSKLICIVSVIDHLAERTGQLIAWLICAMMLVTCLVVLIRYGFNRGSIALQESVTYLHGCIFLLGMAYTLKHNGHVRVDIFYRRFSPPAQAWINSLGALLFTLPFSLLILGVSLGFVGSSWAILERSPEAGGIPAIFLLKTLIPLGAGMLALQAMAEVLRAIPVLLGYIEPGATELPEQL